jgi:hypothetical protein
MNRLISAILLLATSALAQNPGPSLTGATVGPAACVAPTGLVNRWTASAGSTTLAYATDQVAGNNAFQPTGISDPTYSASCAAFSGKPCLAFNGTSDYIIPTTPIPATTNLTVYAIFNLAGGTHNEFFGGIASSIDYQIGGSVANLNQQGVAGGNGIRTLSTGTSYLEVATYNNATSDTEFYAGSSGGTLVSDGNSIQALSFSSATATLGAVLPFSRFLNGSIAEWGYANSVNASNTIAAWAKCQYGVVN